ncbi:MAG: hypothetical protein ACR2HG_14145 [Pyrinomonadaceae bacterium]
MEKQLVKMIRLIVFVLVFPALLQCANKATNSAVVLPKDILGLSVGMSKADADRRLREIADFERDEEKNQQLWRLKNDAHFSEMAVGYDKENRVRYITMFVDAATAKERIRFSDVGDTSRAKQEIMPPHYRYIWEVPASDGNPAYFVNIYGDNPDSVTIYTLNRKYEPDELKNQSEDKEDE